VKLSLATIADLAGKAGFLSDRLPTAAALALVSSGGHPHYDHRVGAPGCGRYVGLWGIDVDRWTEYRPDELAEPWRAARAAYELTQRCDGFGWSPQWCNGAERAYVPMAATAATMVPYRDAVYAPIASEVYARRITQLRDASAQRIARNRAWPRPTR